ncbi:MAG: hypothetical protein SFU25_09130 [Candidatus Caenarcaniphilales bacterium]|nr:hypothetical protein [Candidatus Caenarcaniphilales bacterium]
MKNNFSQFKLKFTQQLCLTFLLSLNFLGLTSLAVPPKPVKPSSKSSSPAQKAVPDKKNIVKDGSAKPAPAKAETIKNEVKNCTTEVSIKELVANPEAWVNKEVCFTGTFNSFSALALDYPPALRERKNYISLTLLRPKTKIPLGELKVAMKIDEAQKHELLPKITEGDEVKIKGKVFSAALGEPWLDVLQIQVTKGPNSEETEENPFEDL